MSYVTKCKGTDCPIKEECKRYTQMNKGDEHFSESPGKITDTGDMRLYYCDMFWGEAQEGILVNLKEILE